MSKLLNVLFSGCIALTCCFANTDIENEMHILVGYAAQITPSTEPHQFDGAMDEWSQRLYNLAKQLYPDVASQDPNTVRERILAAADDVNPNAHGRTERAYIESRYGALGAFVDINNRLQRVVGMLVSKGIINYKSLADNLIPLNDSPSAMYNVFFTFGVHFLKVLLGQEPSFVHIPHVPGVPAVAEGIEPFVSRPVHEESDQFSNASVEDLESAFEHFDIFQAQQDAQYSNINLGNVIDTLVNVLGMDRDQLYAFGEGYVLSGLEAYTEILPAAVNAMDNDVIPQQQASAVQAQTQSAAQVQYQAQEPAAPESVETNAVLVERAREYWVTKALPQMQIRIRNNTNNAEILAGARRAGFSG
ncbi:MAG: hypothetical protein Q8S21_06540 [Candidatus Paracaedibacteraceae bacterium]|nr:hypothetical protein [Candidatus Paracaedibacteraceae bacterium]